MDSADGLKLSNLTCTLSACVIRNRLQPTLHVTAPLRNTMFTEYREHTEPCHLSELLTHPVPQPLSIIFVFFILIRSPLVSLHSFNYLNFSICSSILAAIAISTRSSAYNNSCGYPDRRSGNNASSIIMNNKGQ